MLGNSSPPPGGLLEMNRFLVIGNGESRSWFKPCHQTIAEDVVTWGCNAIYRDGAVHNLVAVDYGMQQEIYDSGYCLDNPEYGDIKTIHFANWNIVPAEIAPDTVKPPDTAALPVTSTPELLVERVVELLDPAEVIHLNGADEDISFVLPLEVR